MPRCKNHDWNCGVSGEKRDFDRQFIGVRSEGDFVVALVPFVLWGEIVSYGRYIPMYFGLFAQSRFLLLNDNCTYDAFYPKNIGLYHAQSFVLTEMSLQAAYTPMTQPTTATMMTP